MPINDVKLGRDVRIFHPELVNLYGCSIGDETKVGTFVEIQKGVAVGARCKISSHSFVCEGVTIEDEVFVGHGVMFINDIEPRATAPDGELQTEADWIGCRDHGRGDDRRARTCGSGRGSHEGRRSGGYRRRRSGSALAVRERFLLERPDASSHCAAPSQRSS